MFEVGSVKESHVSRRRREGGFNLIEVAIVLAIFSVIILAVAVITRTTDHAYQSTVESSNVTFHIRRALEMMTDEIRRSDAVHVTVDNSGAQYDAVELELPIAVSDGDVVWGASSRIGWKIQYLVEEGALIRRVTNAGGIIMEMDQVMAVNVHDDATTGKGFSVTRNGSLYTIGLRLLATEALLATLAP